VSRQGSEGIDGGKYLEVEGAEGLKSENAGYHKTYLRVGNSLWASCPSSFGSGRVVVEMWQIQRSRWRRGKIQDLLDVLYLSVPSVQRIRNGSRLDQVSVGEQRDDGVTNGDAMLGSNAERWS